MPLSNAKLGTQLGTAFFSVVVLTLVLGVFAIFQMSGIYARTDDIATNWMPSVNVLGKMRASVNQIRRAEGDHLLSSGGSDMDDVEQRIAKAKATLAEHTAAYEPLIATPDERRQYDAYRAGLGEYLAAQSALLTLSRAGVASMAQARDAYRGPSRAALLRTLQALESLIDINDKGAAAAAGGAKSSYETARTWVIGLLVLICAAATLLAVTIVRSVTRRLGGEPASAADLAQNVAAGNLSVQIDLRAGDDRSMMAQLKRMQDSLSRVVADVRGNAESVATASAQISQGNADLSQRTEEQASALEETAASMEQLNSTVRQNADNARQANQLAVSASSVAERGGAVVGQVVDTMRGINEGSKRIADIISVIDGIAFQTNILALNAAVEAARAGEQGRGFAVVASEVRSLAQRSADAAKEIKSLISSSVNQVEQGTALVDQAGTTMREVVDSIRRVADIMGEISAASAEQSQGVAQVGEAITQMDQVTQQNAALVEESAAAAASLKQQAQQLVDTVAVFQLDHGAMAARRAMAPTPAVPAPAAARAIASPPAASPVAVRRLSAQPAPAAPKPATRPTAAAPAPAKATQSVPGGNAEDWESF
ncbi:methyl-accepting chemotaxis protein [Xylophilus ampelinus]|uniref:Methyl-accepting chemotaxis protein n=1 Tax=Xylophilus ampelinus TaxID=54067 RepID=A0A318SNW4_9BURK|nr:methyl-accepting chemotaxis protein [Xylophilus ampelinus]MCS4509595.1 methyl-accepting chemotaxis protein [Xylophilus ampelinus]PYE78922.1 methyl-accepting chemotaxis protein [Xylophilus ampelinus]